jgi:putative membrane protein
MMGGGGMMGWGGFGLLGGLIGLIFNLAVIAGVVALVIWAVKRATSGNTNWSNPSSNESPREILQRRYARGEITREQFQQMLQDVS